MSQQCKSALLHRESAVYGASVSFECSPGRRSQGVATAAHIARYGLATARSRQSVTKRGKRLRRHGTPFGQELGREGGGRVKMRARRVAAVGLAGANPNAHRSSRGATGRASIAGTGQAESSVDRRPVHTEGLGDTV